MAITIEELWNQHAEWSQKTFGQDSVRGPKGPLKHLAKEVQECLENNTDIFEYADIIFLAFDATRRAGFSFHDLREALSTKLVINKSRSWPLPTLDEPVEHIRTA